MNVSSQTNTYQVITPIEPPKENKYNNEEIYKASAGNIVRSDGELKLTPQGETNLANAEDDKALASETVAQAEKDAQRGVAVDYVAQQSKKSQVEIYLAVATDNSNNNSTANVIESLREVQKQNKAVEAYSNYQVNQEYNKPTLY